MDLRAEAERLGIAFTNESTPAQLRAQIFERQTKDEVDDKLIKHMECYGEFLNRTDPQCIDCAAQERCQRFMGLNTVRRYETEYGRPLSLLELQTILVQADVQSIQTALEVYDRLKKGKIQGIEDAPTLLEILDLTDRPEPTSEEPEQSEAEISIEGEIIEDPSDASFAPDVEEEDAEAEEPAESAEELDKSVDAAEDEDDSTEESADPVEEPFPVEEYRTRWEEERKRIPDAAHLYPGFLLKRRFKGREHRVEVRLGHYVYEGEVYPTLAAVTDRIAGTKKFLVKGTNRTKRKGNWSAAKFWKKTLEAVARANKL